MVNASSSPGLIAPVILSGGSGTRLWPLSRAGYPKQFFPLVGTNSMIQDTALRVADPDRFCPPLVVCNAEHRFVVAEHLRAIDQPPSAIVLEPVGRNTAPAVAVAALRVADRLGPETLMLVMPSDHVITDSAAFRAAVDRAAVAARAAEGGALVTFGITPDRPETGYGYIKAGAPVAGASGVWAVDRFVEKPDRATAEGYLAEGGYAWNSGIFLFPAGTVLEEMARSAPEVLAAARKALEGAEADLGFLRLESEAFAAAPSVSVDVAVMEHTRRALVVPVGMGWSDLGAWSALWDLGPRDAAGNVTQGDVLVEDTTNAYLRADQGLVAVVGLDNVVVVTTDDAILVADRDRAQDVKAIVDRLKAEGRSEHALHTLVHRPWGSYQGIDRGERFQVKHLMVSPGERLSLQMHHHRAEHWIVVSGTARVTKGEETFLVTENQSTYIPAGTLHRLENPGKIPLHLIEVQSGSYLGEDDIVRVEDGYGRLGAKTAEPETGGAGS